MFHPKADLCVGVVGVGGIGVCVVDGGGDLGGGGGSVSFVHQYGDEAHGVEKQQQQYFLIVVVVVVL